MIIRYHAQLTIEVNEKPYSDSEWEKFNISLESIMEKALEENTVINIKTAEMILDEE